jgi:hypothetical protein
MARQCRSPGSLDCVPAIKPDPLPGYVWLETPGKVLHVREKQLEFTDNKPARTW